MTDKQLSFEELQEEIKSCKEENTAKSEFLSMVTHQLRTPLSGNKWVFKMVLDGDMGELSAEQRDVLKKGAIANQQMIDLLQEIIRANQNETWDFQYNIAKVDIRKIISTLVTNFKELANSHKVSLELDQTHENFPLIEIDPEKIRFALQNLIENAIKYSHESGVVKISVGIQDDQVMLKVKDDGIGIPEQQQHEIFHKFFRADNAKERKKEGTGLGLFTAKKIVERHHGDVWFESKENKGATFFIKLPFTQEE